MALLHVRDGPVGFGVLGLLQPLVDGAKLLLQCVVLSEGVLRVWIFVGTASVLCVALTVG